MLRSEATSVTAEPDIVAGLAEPEGEAVVVVAAVGAWALKEAVHEEDGELGLLVGLFRRFGGDVGAVVGDGLGEVWAKMFAVRVVAFGVFFGIVDVVKVDNEAVLSLDLEGLDVQADSPRVVRDVADNMILSSFCRWELIRRTLFVSTVHTNSLLVARHGLPSFPLMLLLPPILGPAPLLLVKGPLLINIAKRQDVEDVVADKRDTREERAEDNDEQKVQAEEEGRHAEEQTLQVPQAGGRAIERKGREERVRGGRGHGLLEGVAC